MAGYEHWCGYDSENCINEGATNESGFTGLPAGFRDSYYGLYNYMGIYGMFWSSSESSSSVAWGMSLLSCCSYGELSGGNNHYGFSIRCLSDELGEFGCTDPEACNYDETATADDGSCAYEYDCAGTCGGDLEPDCCGVCGGDNSQCSNCCGSPFYEDCTDDCSIDINEECCYELEVDACGVCNGGGDGTDCNDDGIPDDCEEVYDEGYDLGNAEGYTAGLEEGILLGTQSGDVNGDGVLNVIDIVIFVDMIMNP